MRVQHVLLCFNMVGCAVTQECRVSEDSSGARCNLCENDCAALDNGQNGCWTNSEEGRHGLCECTYTSLGDCESRPSPGCRTRLDSTRSDEADKCEQCTSACADDDDDGDATCDVGDKWNSCSCDYEDREDCESRNEDHMEAALPFDLSSFCSRQEPSGNLSCLPGVRYGIVGRGFDITTDSTEPHNLINVRKLRVTNGFFTASGTSAEFQFRSERFSHPPELEVVPNQEFSIQRDETTSNSLREYQESVSASLNVGYGMISSSVSVSESAAQAFQRSRRFAKSKAMKTEYVMRLKPINELLLLGVPLNHVFVNTANRMDEVGVDIAQASDDFIQMFGTHLITQVTMGGFIQVEATADQCSQTTDLVRVAAAAVEGSHGFGSAGASGEVSDSQSATQSDSSLSCTLRARGGDSTICIGSGCSATCDQQEWQRSLEASNLVPIAFQLMTWSDYFRDMLLGALSEYSEERRANVERIIEEINTAVQRHADNNEKSSPTPTACEGVEEPSDSSASWTSWPFLVVVIGWFQLA